MMLMIKIIKILFKNLILIFHSLIKLLIKFQDEESQCHERAYAQVFPKLPAVSRSWCQCVSWSQP